MAASRAALIILAAAFVDFFLDAGALEVDAFDVEAPAAVAAVVVPPMGIILPFFMLSTRRGSTPPCGMVTFLNSYNFKKRSFSPILLLFYVRTTFLPHSRLLLNIHRNEQ